MEKRNQRNFRPIPENQKRLEYAEQIGLNVSELINEVLKKYLKPTLDSKVSEVRRQLSTPVP